MSSQAHIGPNAIIQVLAALDQVPGRRARVWRASKLETPAPTNMVPEAWFVRLVAAVRATLPAHEAEAVLADGGRRTAAYVAAHRIPAPLRFLLARLPARWGVALLLRAFDRHAWTFAGAGRYRGRGNTITLADAPTCRGGPPASRRRGGYYAAAFEGLLRLAAPSASVREITCQACGDDRCRFAITFET